MVRKLGGDDDAFICYRTAEYKLHYYETPSNLRFVLLTDTGTMSMRNVLHQIYINLWVEYGTWRLGFRAMPPPQGKEGGVDSTRENLSLSLSLPSPHPSRTWHPSAFPADVLTPLLVVKNPLSPVEHKGGEGVKNELFELGLDQFLRGLM